MAREVIRQPGGGTNKPTFARSVKTVTAPVRLGPAKRGGNKPIDANPFGTASKGRKR